MVNEALKQKKMCVNTGLRRVLGVALLAGWGLSVGCGGDELQGSERELDEMDWSTVGNVRTTVKPPPLLRVPSVPLQTFQVDWSVRGKPIPVPGSPQDPIQINGPVRSLPGVETEADGGTPDAGVE